MEKPELTMDDIVTAVNAADDDFILVVELGEEDGNAEKKESLQA